MLQWTIKQDNISPRHPKECSDYLVGSCHSVKWLHHSIQGNIFIAFVSCWIQYSGTEVLITMAHVSLYIPIWHISVNVFAELWQTNLILLLWARARPAGVGRITYQIANKVFFKITRYSNEFNTSEGIKPSFCQIEYKCIRNELKSDEKYKLLDSVFGCVLAWQTGWNQVSWCNDSQWKVSKHANRANWAHAANSDLIPAPNLFFNWNIIRFSPVSLSNFSTCCQTHVMKSVTLDFENKLHQLWKWITPLE